MTADNKSGGLFTFRPEALRPALLEGFVLGVAAVASYLLAAHGLAAIHSLSPLDDQIGGLWAAVATIFVCRFAYHESINAADSRTIATLLSFALCLAYLLVFPFSPLGLAVIIGLGTVILRLFGHDKEIVTAGITTVVILVIAAPNPDPWEEPILRLVDTLIGIAVGVAAVWLVRGPIRAYGSAAT